MDKEKVIDPMVPDANKQYLTEERIKQMLPKGVNHKVTDEIVKLVNRMENDINIKQEYMEESWLDHLHLLGEVKTDLKTYTNAIKYCNLTKHYTNEKAWSIVFPDRYRKLLKSGRDPSVDVAIYNGRPVVTKLQALMRSKISLQYAPEFHEALMVNVKLMRGKASGKDKYGNDLTASPMVQHLAAKAVMEMAKPDETEKEQVAVTVDPGGIIKEYEQAFSMAAMRKLKAIEEGADLVEAINAPVRASKNDAIDVEVEVEVEDKADINSDIYE